MVFGFRVYYYNVVAGCVVAFVVVLFVADLTIW